jgi:hypothetical protein
MACRTCTVPLNRYVDLTTGQVTYTHPLGVDVEPVGHDPDPAPMDEIDTRQMWCATRRLVVSPVQLGGTRREVPGSDG